MKQELTSALRVFRVNKDSICIHVDTQLHIINPEVYEEEFKKVQNAMLKVHGHTLREYEKGRYKVAYFLNHKDSWRESCTIA